MKRSGKTENRKKNQQKWQRFWRHSYIQHKKPGAGVRPVPGKKLSWNMRVIGKNMVITLGLLLLATVVAYFYDQLTPQTMNIMMFYTLALLLISRTTDGYLPGILAAMISVVCVNYLFTYPYWKINFTLDGYPVTFFGMMVVSVLTSASASHMKRQSEVLAEREKMLAEAGKEKMRANLLRAVSHDLRTPLTGIIGASSSYLENEAHLSEEEKHSLVQHIEEDADWLLNMVENLLTVTRIQGDAGSVNKSMEPVEEVMSEAVFRLKKRIPDAKVKVELPEEFVMIPMDAMLIEQVLVNLMENAIYHGGSTEPVECSVSIEKDFVTIYVTDHGIGIPEEKIDTIFDGTGQTESSSSDGHKGMGIGLSICKTIILAHGGTIRVRNLEQGAQFSFTLPRGEDTGAE